MKHYTAFPLLISNHHLGDCLMPDVNFNGRISRLYDIIQNINPPTLSRMRDDLKLTITDTSWDNIIDRIYSSSICSCHCHRLYFTEAKLSKMFSTSDDSCPRCHQSPATIGHMFWSCNISKHFWSSIFEVFEDLSFYCRYIFMYLHRNPYMVIFGVPLAEHVISIKCHSIYSTGSTSNGPY